MAVVNVSAAHAPVPMLGVGDATDPARAGAKAANLARAAAEGLPVLPGFVLPVGAADGRGLAEADRAMVQRAWAALSEDGRRPLVVRSSSPVEDGATSSKAGMFTSVLDVRGWPAFLAAVETVVASAGGDAMAVLVQPHLGASVGGVLFGADPVTCRRDRMVAVAVRGGPDRLVHGEVGGAVHVLSPRGGLLERDGDDGPLLPRRARRALAALARDVAVAFGGPQDVEWAFDADGRLWLLQTRPITTLPLGPVEGPVLGPGPVAETFPDPLTSLEADLWLAPLREGLRHALPLVGAAPARQVRRSPVVLAVGGRAAADLGLLGGAPPRSLLVRLLDPRPRLRRLGASWRSGRLRAALPAIAADLLARLDADLAAVPSLTGLPDDDLLGLLHRCRRALVALHAHEVLSGALATGEASAPSATGAALSVLAEARAAGLDDDAVARAHPVVLALSPPAVAPAGPLPSLPPPVPGAGGASGVPEPGLLPPGAGLPAAREALRLRARWVQELSARAALELGRRLAARGVLTAPADVRHLSLDDVAGAVRGGRVAVAASAPAGPPLPAAFRLTGAGAVVPEAARRATSGDGRGAGGGRARGPVHHGPTPPPGAVLVVRTLDPGLAAVLPGLAAVVSETGSALSHLAILARELGVPTVVGVPRACHRFPAGTMLEVDGTSGRVTRVDGER